MCKLVLLSCLISALFACETDIHESVCTSAHLDASVVFDPADQTKLVVANTSGALSAENLQKSAKIADFSIVDSEVTGLDRDLFHPIANLSQLTIVRNRNVPKIGADLFRSASNLVKLYLDSVQLENGLFGALTSLTTLSINASRLPNGNELKKSVLSGLKSVKSVSITNCGLETIEVGTFQEFVQLKYLDLHGNQLVVVEKLFTNLPKLQVLNLAENEIRSLIGNEFQLKALNVLYLEGNNFTRIDIKQVLDNSPNLERVFFTENKLEADNRKEIEEILTAKHINFIYIGPKPLF